MTYKLKNCKTNNIMSELKYAEEFNTVIKKLSSIYVSKKRGSFDEESTVRNNKRLLLLTRTEPMFLITQAGPVLVKYSDMITSRDWEGLMNCDFSEEKKQHSKVSDDKVNREIDFIKNTFQLCSETEKNHLGDLVQTLLRLYCEYSIQFQQ